MGVIALSRRGQIDSSGDVTLLLERLLAYVNEFATPYLKLRTRHIQIALDQVSRVIHLLLLWVKLIVNTFSDD